MRPEPDFSFEQIVKVLIHDLVDAVGNRPDLSPARQKAVQQAVVCSVMAMQPRDPLETMLAAQCLVYDRLLLDGASDILRGQAEEIKIANRSGVLSAGKLFLQTLAALRREQARPETDLAFARREPAPPGQPAPIVASPPPADQPRHAEPPHAEPGPDKAFDPARGEAPTHPPTADTPPMPEPDASFDQAVAALAEMIAPGKIEAMLLGNLDPEERQKFMEEWARQGSA